MQSTQPWSGRGTTSPSPVAEPCSPHNRGLAGIPPSGNQRGACLGGFPPPPTDRQSSAITGLFPYGRYALNPHLSFRALLGYGTGDLALSPSRQEQLGTTINLSLAAVGLDGVLLDGGATGLTISSSADGLFLQTGSEKADGLAAAEGDLSRLRLALAASRPFPLNNQSSWLTPALELGLRQDSGDGETGFGLELVASLRWLTAEHGMAVTGAGAPPPQPWGGRRMARPGALRFPLPGPNPLFPTGPFPVDLPRLGRSRRHRVGCPPLSGRLPLPGGCRQQCGRRPPGVGGGRRLRLPRPWRRPGPSARGGLEALAPKEGRQVELVSPALAPGAAG